jgi:acetyl esterase/lipase
MDTYIQWIKILKHNYGMEVMIMSVDYRLAPECKYPGPVEDVVRAYEHLVRTLNVDADKIIAAGDCAGATLVLEMLFITHDPSMFEIVTDDVVGPTLSELPRPAGAVFSSPIVTDETSAGSWKDNAKYDYISQNTARIIKRDYFEPLGPDAPPDANQILGIAKLETGFKAFFPEQVLMFLGDKEVLREDCVHDWFVIREVVKDKKMLMRADIAFADFCYRAVRQIRRNSTVRNTNLDHIKVLYEQHSSSEYSSMRRSSEGLENIVEEEEDDEDYSSQPYFDFDDFQTSIDRFKQGEDSFSDTDLESAFGVSSPNISSKQFTSSSTVNVASRVTKQKPMTVFV